MTSLRTLLVVTALVLPVSSCRVLGLVNDEPCASSTDCASDARCDSTRKICLPVDDSGEGEGEGAVVAEGEGEVIVVAEGEGEGVVVAEGEGEGVVVAEGEGEGVVVAEGEGEGVVVAEGEGEGEGIPDPSPTALGDPFDLAISLGTVNDCDPIGGTLAFNVVSTRAATRHCPITLTNVTSLPIDILAIDTRDVVAPFFVHALPSTTRLRMAPGDSIVVDIDAAGDVVRTDGSVRIIGSRTRVIPLHSEVPDSGVHAFADDGCNDFGAIDGVFGETCAVAFENTGPTSAEVANVSILSPDNGAFEFHLSLTNTTVITPSNVTLAPAQRALLVVHANRGPVGSAVNASLLWRVASGAQPGIPLVVADRGAVPSLAVVADAVCATRPTVECTGPTLQPGLSGTVVITLHNPGAIDAYLSDFAGSSAPAGLVDARVLDFPSVGLAELPLVFGPGDTRAIRVQLGVQPSAAPGPYKYGLTLIDFDSGIELANVNIVGAIGN